MFKVGQRVVCVNDKPTHPVRDGLKTPKKGKIYTIREIYESKVAPGRVAVLLDEIQNDEFDRWGHEIGFFSDRFRPLVDTYSLESEMFADEVLKYIEEEIEETFLVRV